MYEEAFNNSDAIVCKSSKKITAVIVDDVFYKLYRYRGFFHSLRHIFITPRTRRVQHAAAVLRQNGVLTPEVLAAVAVKKFGFFPLYEVLLTRALRPEETVLTRERASFYHVNRTQSIAALSKLLAAVHRAGIAHGDMNMRNIYRSTDVGGKATLGVIDLDNAQDYGQVPTASRRRELARLISSFVKSAKCGETEEVSRQFADAYRAETGLDLYDPKLISRVKYLAQRVRK